LFWGIELVSDRANKAPFGSGRRLHAKVKSEAMKLGLMCYPMGGTVNGKDGDHVLLAPPFIVNSDNVAQIADTVGDAIDNAIANP
jgi:adenosylmethionine-8-amino-7-oxononanoate aminotransferase